MVKVGVTTRKIRLIKGLSQKQVYGGIISRSFANRFENGTNDIQAGKFLKILDNLAISPTEFQYINNNYEPSKIDQMLAEVSYLYSVHAFSSLAHWLQQHKSSENEQVQIVAGFAELMLTTYGYRKFPLSKNIHMLVYHLISEKNWTVQEIRIVSMLVPVIATHEQFKIEISTITERMEQNCSHYLTKYSDPFQINDELVNYYGVVFQNYLNSKAYIKACAMREKFISLDEKLFDWDTRISQQLWLAVWELYFGDFKSGKQTLEKIIDFKKIFKEKFALNIEAITKVRVQDSQKYRNSKKE
ncbi:transcriptional regulator [Ligilactobacillus pabuli]|uniref:Transcriptional regulator n=1 Tax=Ligilactobacillus pabuli TaxID=2886039 RepID=A0ABQ5JPI0_9LACO|nr:helix-turn-helix transcriptional regulator [Ligilactobacillus pabuli]GKS82425.1 transcriptional regulator [Ligilactobacillus pabuli]